MGPMVWELDGPGPHLKMSKSELATAGRKGGSYEAPGAADMNGSCFALFMPSRRGAQASLKDDLRQYRIRLA
jgi:hypothetical protein